MYSTIQYSILMFKKIWQKTRSLVTKFDFFSDSKLLRYDQEPDYKSLNGGLFSIVVLIIFLIVFINKTLETINRTVIKSTTTLYQEEHPSVFTTKSSGFMFAIGIADFNLADPITKYFDIKIAQAIANTNNNGQRKSNATYLNLIPCSRQVWTSAYPNIGDTFDRRKFKNWLCLDPDATLSIQGKFTSDIFQYLKLTVKACTNDSSSNRTCVNQSIIDKKIKDFAGSVPFNYYFMNTVIKANEKDYLGNYLEDRNYFTFNKKSGFLANLFISVYNISTDVSLSPTTDIVEDKGGIVYEPTQNLVQDVNDGNPNYIQLYIRKSSLSMSIQRSFLTYFDCFSYIGGLFGAILTLISFMSFYNESAYEIDAASGIFKQTAKQKIKTNYFNVFTYAAQLFYSLIHYFGANPEWKLLKQFDNARQQISKQLNIKLIIKKIGFLQDCMEYLFEDFQLKCLHLKDKLTLDEAAKTRRKFSSRPLLLKLKKKRIQQKKEENKTKAPNSLENLNQKRFLSKSDVRMMPSLQIDNNSNQIIIVDNKRQIDYQSDIIKSMHKDKQAVNQDSIIKNDRYEQGQEGPNEDRQSSDEESLSQSSEGDEKAFYQETLNSLHQLQQEAKQGKYRCLKIFNSLDQTIKEVAGITFKEASNSQNDGRKFPSIPSVNDLVRYNAFG